MLPDGKTGSQFTLAGLADRDAIPDASTQLRLGIPYNPLPRTPYMWRDAVATRDARKASLRLIHRHQGNCLWGPDATQELLPGDTWNVLKKADRPHHFVV